MTDDFDISPPNADADDGDERLRALLAVAPLDEVTRRRLVTTAIAAARPEDEAARGPRSHRRVAWLSGRGRHGRRARGDHDRAGGRG